MAIVTQALQAALTDRFGEVPTNLATAISSLSAAQRDQFTWAWMYASDTQRQRPADEWVLREEDREDFEAFRLLMLDV
ncbi:hypothetical protein [Curtobacterium sp. MCPF17_052]|uniref:hypothetical protein n=1 Tax=Curtobacterium sp. MCPF17_052 TaxID=2175655 RepID=UPI000DA963B8|nr:hypothetical protein [Curtobacterium sp. MCPF17_052]WIB12906.1 hypothetical protein DEJ36_02455 [Curtobacterium sp. MCPF17_052]